MSETSGQGQARGGRTVARRALGKSGLEAGALAFGGNVFGWTVDESLAFRLLDAFVDAGYNLVDTADTYGPRGGDRKAPGASEEILGRWLQRGGKRHRVLLATKVGRDFSTEQRGLSKHAITRGVEASLGRLRTDHIDIYFAHVDDPDASQDETSAAFDALVRQGKMRTLGASNFTRERLLSALAIGREGGRSTYQVLQPGYNLYDRAAFESEFLPLVEQEGLGVMAHSALARGFLTGKYRRHDDLVRSARGNSVGGYLGARGQDILRALDTVAREFGASPAQVALAWLLAQPHVDAAIVSATSLDQLSELLGAGDLKLDQRILDYLDRAGDFRLVEA